MGKKADKRVFFLTQCHNRKLTGDLYQANRWYIDNNGKSLDIEEALTKFKAWLDAQWPKSSYDACAAIEGFDGLEHTEEEILAAWQYLIDCGDAWTLQGFYGRGATSLINGGLCHG